jgi:nucleotide-binding universal stress UspA family protein
VYHRILVALDGSKFAEAALPWALSLAGKTRAGVHLVCVVEPIPGPAFEGWEFSARNWSEEYLAEAVDRVSDQTPGEVTSSLRSGHVVEALLDEALSTNSDLMVMATHGRGALSRAWLGSVADGVVRRADFPVLCVRPDERERAPAGATTGARKILVPLDGSDLSEDALAYATEMGALFDSAYHLTRVVAYPLDPGSPFMAYTTEVGLNVLEDLKESASRYLEEHAERMRRQGLRVTTSAIVDGQAAHGILADVDSAGCDMIAMATHGRGGMQRLVLGSAADKVLRGTRVPVLLHRMAPAAVGA